MSSHSPKQTQGVVVKKSGLHSGSPHAPIAPRASGAPPSTPTAASSAPRGSPTSMRGNPSVNAVPTASINRAPPPPQPRTQTFYSAPFNFTAHLQRPQPSNTTTMGAAASTSSSTTNLATPPRTNRPQQPLRTFSPPQAPAPSVSTSSSMDNVTTHNSATNVPPLVLCAYDWKTGSAHSRVILRVLGDSFVARGKRVLYVDANVKCVLSSRLMGESNDSPDFTDSDGVLVSPPSQEQQPSNEMELSDDESNDELDFGAAHLTMEEPIRGPVNCDLYDLLRPWILGEAAPSEPLPPLRLYVPNAYLVRGSPKIIEFEMAVQHLSGNTAFGESSVQQMGAFSYLIREMAEKNNIDVVLVDPGMDTSALNRMFMLSCDYILPVSSADALSLTFTQSWVRYCYRDWKKWHEDFVKHEIREAAKCETHAERDQQIKLWLPPMPSFLPLWLHFPKSLLASNSSTSSAPSEPFRAGGRPGEKTLAQWITDFSDAMRPIPVELLSNSDSEQNSEASAPGSNAMAVSAPRQSTHKDRVRALADSIWELHIQKNQ